MERLKRNLHLVSTFPKLNKKQQKLLQKNLNSDQIKFICELCINIIEKSLLLDPKTHQKLKIHKDKIRKLANSKYSLKEKQKAVQVGGFLPVLLSALAGSALSFILEKYAGNGQREAKNS